MNDLMIKGVKIRVRDMSLCVTDLWRATNEQGAL